MDKQSVHTVEIIWGNQTVRICVGAQEDLVAPYLLFLRDVYGEDNVIFRPNTGMVTRTDEETKLAEQIWKQAHEAMIQAIKDAQKKLEAEQKEEKTNEMMINQSVADSNWQDMERLWAQREARMRREKQEEEAERKAQLLNEQIYQERERLLNNQAGRPCPNCGGARWTVYVDEMYEECEWCGYTTI